MHIQYYEVHILFTWFDNDKNITAETMHIF